MKAVRVVNQRDGSVVLDTAGVALTLWERFCGLMGRQALPMREGLLLPDCSSIHTCFMRFAMDAVYVDRAGRVIRIVEAIKPWRMSRCAGAESVLEMAGGGARRAGLEVGDCLGFLPLER